MLGALRELDLASRECSLELGSLRCGERFGVNSQPTQLLEASELHESFEVDVPG